MSNIYLQKQVLKSKHLEGFHRRKVIGFILQNIQFVIAETIRVIHGILKATGREIDDNYDNNKGSNGDRDNDDNDEDDDDTGNDNDDNNKMMMTNEPGIVY